MRVGAVTGLSPQRWSGPEKLLALDELIDRCEPSQIKYMMQVIEPQFQRDFISLLPKEVGRAAGRASCGDGCLQGPGDSVCPRSWPSTSSPSWSPGTCSALPRPVATGGSWLKTTCSGERSAARKVETPPARGRGGCPARAWATAPPLPFLLQASRSP